MTGRVIARPEAVAILRWLRGARHDGGRFAMTGVGLAGDCFTSFAMTGVGLAGDCFTSFAMTGGRFAMTGSVIARPEGGAQ